jgi:hypothetical protein
MDFDFIYQAVAASYWTTTAVADNTNPTNVSPSFDAFTLILNNGSNYVTIIATNPVYSGNPIKCIKN